MRSVELTAGAFFKTKTALMVLLPGVDDEYIKNRRMGIEVRLLQPYELNNSCWFAANCDDGARIAIYDRAELVDANGETPPRFSNRLSNKDFMCFGFYLLGLTPDQQSILPEYDMCWRLRQLKIYRKTNTDRYYFIYQDSRIEIASKAHLSEIVRFTGSGYDDRACN